MATCAGVNQNSAILIIGAGTWGCSTALHLARRGYTNITVLDPYPVPSPISAGDDINKILDLNRESGSTEEERHVSRTLYDAVMKGWTEDEVFSPYFHDTGIVIAASSPEGVQHIKDEEGCDGPEWTPLTSASDFHATMPPGVLTGDFPNWRGWWKKAGHGAGWVHARNAMTSAATEARRRGVNFISGEHRGKVTSLLISANDVRGAITADGVHHHASHTILCAGANAASLLDFHHQLLPKAWTLAHIKLTASEAQLYRNLPVLFNCERGFFMEPDCDHHELKICDEHPGYCNWLPATTNTASAQPTRPDGRRDMPFARHQIPLEATQRIQLFLQETLPHLSTHPITFARICWCADTPDRHFLIATHPAHPSLTLGVGGSGHGYVYIPAIGQLIADCMEGKLDARLGAVFRWRPETARNRDWRDAQGRYGPKGWNRVMDLQEVEGWTCIPEDEG